nr:SDR family NAD(P)-dependent oxidoreductase [Spiroplasma mirum]
MTWGNMRIGYEIALALAKAGADLYIFCYDNTNTAQMGKEVVKLGRKIVFKYGDLTNSKTLVQIVPHVLQNFQHLDIVVNNAGAIFRTPILAGTDEEWQRVIAINLTTVYQLSREAAQVMVNQQSGKIINIASMLSYQEGKFVPSYNSF